MSKQIQKVIGSPGCGKTTYLLNRIEGLFKEGAEPSDIGFVTFTTAGVAEAKQRAIERFNYKDSDFQYFKTLHAFAYSLLELSRDQVFAGRHAYNFSKQMNLKLSWGDDSFSTPDDEAMFIINLSHVTATPLRQLLRTYKGKYDIPATKVLKIAEEYANFKQANGLLDYTDMLTQAIDCFMPTVKYLLMDEAQDSSRLQWNLFNKLSERSSLVLIAGDDKQAIHTYAGADVNYFVNYKADSTINLGQSYRVPSTIQKLADKIISKVKIKHDVVWEPRNEKGMVLRRDMFNANIITSTESWLVLARNRSILERYSHDIMKRGLVYTLNGKPPINKDIFRAIKEFNGDKTNSELLKKFIPAKQYDVLIKANSWEYAFAGVSLIEKRYVKLLLQNHEDPLKISFKDAKIRLATIHTSKGTEADNVVLINGMTNVVAKQYDIDKDSELRVLFVAVTRARKNLIIVNDYKAARRYEVL